MFTWLLIQEGSFQTNRQPRSQILACPSARSHTLRYISNYPAHKIAVSTQSTQKIKMIGDLSLKKG